jgi:hypothetical protein
MGRRVTPAAVEGLDGLDGPEDGSSTSGGRQLGGGLGLDPVLGWELIESIPTRPVPAAGQPHT